MMKEKKNIRKQVNYNERKCACCSLGLEVRSKGIEKLMWKKKYATNTLSIVRIAIVNKDTFQIDLLRDINATTTMTTTTSYN